MAGIKSQVNISIRRMDKDLNVNHFNFTKELFFVITKVFYGVILLTKFKALLKEITRSVRSVILSPLTSVSA